MRSFHIQIEVKQRLCLKVVSWKLFHTHSLRCLSKNCMHKDVLIMLLNTLLYLQWVEHFYSKEAKCKNPWEHLAGSCSHCCYRWNFIISQVTKVPFTLIMTSLNTASDLKNKCKSMYLFFSQFQSSTMWTALKPFQILHIKMEGERGLKWAPISSSHSCRSEVISLPSHH